jgi:hypothetical protein
MASALRRIENATRNATRSLKPGNMFCKGYWKYVQHLKTVFLQRVIKQYGGRVNFMKLSITQDN